MSFTKIFVISSSIACAGVVIVALLKKIWKDPSINSVSVDILDYKYVLGWLQQKKSIIKKGTELITLRNEAARKLLKEHLKYEMSDNEVLYVLQYNDKLLAHLVVKYNTISDSYLDMLGTNDVFIQKIE
ncbi:MAG: hypothetical protein SOT07_09310 [Paludibacteraceae bacterium]|nr:hypothetical protein [Paludibacteraceae bacterium]